MSSRAVGQTGFNLEKLSGVYQLNVLELELNWVFINKTTK